MSQRQPRLHDEGYLRFLRSKPCCICANPAPSEACHIRYGSPAHGKPETGMGEKPSDKWALPMCQQHHRMQHSGSERAFWLMWKYDPLQMAILYYAMYGGSGGKAKGPRKIAPRKPRGQRAKIKGRSSFR